MQFFGYDQNQPVFAENAIKGRDYRCPECHGLLRIKEGIHRQKHFFHLHSSYSCRQCRKTNHHLAIQKTIWKSLPHGEALLEKRFPSIQRIADIAWTCQKIVFEIQCSPITLKEVKARNSAYQKLGFWVVWVLHDKRFNRFFLSAAEAFLRCQSSYFTNIDSHGNGIVYDQVEHLRNHRRLRKGPSLTVYLNKPKSLSIFPNKLPPFLRKKFDRSRYIFTGDLLDRISYRPEICADYAAFEQPSSQPSFSLLAVIKLIQSYYRLCLCYLLNKTSF
ncbi:MAG: competence protein CoiA family protein [Chlamydiota bacterium]